MHIARPEFFVIVYKHKCTCKLSFSEMCSDALIEIYFCFRFRITCLCFTRCTVYLFLDGIHVLEDKLGVNDLDIACWVDRTVNVYDIRIIKAPDYMQDRINITDMREELVAKSFARCCAFDKTGN